MTVTVTYDIAANVEPTTISNTANITSDEDTTSANDTVDVTEDVTLTAVKTFTADPVTAGSTGNTFTIQVTNTGSSTADNINITDTVDPALTVTNMSSASIRRLLRKQRATTVDCTSHLTGFRCIRDSDRHLRHRSRC